MGSDAKPAAPSSVAAGGSQRGTLDFRNSPEKIYVARTSGRLRGISFV